MLKKLRIKFIALSMIMVGLVLIGTFLIIGITEYNREQANVTNALQTAIDQTAHAAEKADNANPATTPNPSEPAPDQTETRNDISSPQIGRAYENGPTQFSVPLAVYSLDDQGKFNLESDFTTASLSDEVLAQASSEIEDTDASSGELNDVGLYYLKTKINDTTYIAFADSSSASNWQSLAVKLVIAGVITLIVLFIITYYFSRWALRPVKEAWDSQRQFIADASHELKTPLTVILANTSILKKHPKKTLASQSQWIEGIEYEAQTMESLTNEMLELAQIESAPKHEHLPLNLSDLIDRNVLQFESLAYEKEFTLNADVEADIEIKGDEARLNKMVDALIENAAKYTNVGGSIDVNLKKKGNLVLFSVHNEGTPIPAEDLPHIFDRFYRSNKARTSGTGGFGLGLAIARGIAEEHGGDITVTSSQAEGTTFIATLQS
ncbi:MAG: ATP-binding protein [Eggerthellaceae bacterium]|jgi:two-component system sensor histidine kinase CiaH